MKADQHYSKAIDILVNSELDWKSIVVALAKKAPDLFVKLAEEVAPPHGPEMFGVKPDLKLYTQVGEELKFNGKVPAIKMLRNALGCGLKEAKDYVEQAY